MFSSRWALVLVALGMAIGTGNIWRFPRILAKFDGGGTFLIPWMIFLFSWSIPLLIVEFSIGRSTRHGVVASLGSMLGPRFGFIGAFVALCTTMILCYYAVVAGWCGIYVYESLAGNVANMDTKAATDWFVGRAQGGLATLATVVALVIAAYFVSRGLRNGVERANKVLLPTLFALLFVLMIFGLTRDGAGQGVAWLFKVNGAQLATASPWLEALSQSAFSTGAGWGLLLTFAIGSAEKGTGIGNAVMTGIGNNVASLIAALAIVPAIFALAPLASADPVQVLQTNSPGNTGMAMVWIPQLFAEIGPAGRWLAAAFFLTLAFAAITSLIAMVELATRCMMDLGFDRHRSILVVTVAALLIGLPSALNLEFLSNQDWVWGLGLLVSGFLCVLAVKAVGFRKFREDWIRDDPTKRPLGAWFDLVLAALIPLQFVVLLGWWFQQSVSWAKSGSTSPWDPFDTYSIGTCLTQWAAAFFVLFLLRGKLRRHSLS
ncbi:MAG: sodium-dependent transporter [Planctomycetes bacterium]|nr:sodium-dependent transporter [Planctomycetota bacterium]